MKTDPIDPKSCRRLAAAVLVTAIKNNKLTVDPQQPSSGAPKVELTFWSDIANIDPGRLHLVE